ncbi:type II toxin-antitoxin system VapB family antitoxin [Sphingomonas sp. DT-204]|uniref:type II toxin-antitoxin system VapB family antitoxin n=1 Tax=Sphingomonas sp. DT-204 TaxID=3396166 RepID=UPI003F1C3ECF
MARRRGGGKRAKLSAVQLAAERPMVEPLPTEVEMGVQLNIKDAETIRLARKLAEQKGESVTATIKAALEREYREREEQLQESLRRVREISAQFRAGLRPEWQGKSSKEIMDAIYDEDGLPI